MRPVAPEPARDAPGPISLHPVGHDGRCTAGRGTRAACDSVHGQLGQNGAALGRQGLPRNKCAGQEQRCLPCRYRRLHERSRAEQGGWQIGWRWTRRNPDRSATTLNASHASADASAASLGSARRRNDRDSAAAPTDLQRGSVGVDRRLVIASLIEVVSAVLRAPTNRANLRCVAP